MYFEAENLATPQWHVFLKANEKCFGEEFFVTYSSNSFLFHAMYICCNFLFIRNGTCKLFSIIKKRKENVPFISFKFC